jgi:hypothetical protein
MRRLSFVQLITVGSRRANVVAMIEDNGSTAAGLFRARRSGDRCEILCF